MQQGININNLQPVLKDSRAFERDSPFTDCETDKLRSKIGQLLWVDIMFDTCILASTLKHGTVLTMDEANKVVKKLKTEHVTQKFGNTRRTYHCIDGQGRDILTCLLAI